MTALAEVKMTTSNNIKPIEAKGFEKIFYRGATLLLLTSTVHCSQPIQDSVSASEKPFQYSFIKSNVSSYNKPEPISEASFIKSVSKEAFLMKKDAKINSSYFSGKIVTDFIMPKKVGEEVFDFSEDFEYVSDTPKKYNYSFNEVLKDYDTLGVNKNRETYEF